MSKERKDDERTEEILDTGKYLKGFKADMQRALDENRKSIFAVGFAFALGLTVGIVAASRNKKD